MNTCVFCQIIRPCSAPRRTPGTTPASNLITSAGAAATQSIDHLHIHFVPRKVDDGLMTPWGTIYGDEPSAPHWCRQAQNVYEALQASTMTRQWP